MSCYQQYKRLMRVCDQLANEMRSVSRSSLSNIYSVFPQSAGHQRNRHQRRRRRLPRHVSSILQRIESNNFFIGTIDEKELLTEYWPPTSPWKLEYNSTKVKINFKFIIFYVGGFACYFHDDFILLLKITAIKYGIYELCFLE